MNNFKYICLSFVLISCFASKTVEAPKQNQEIEEYEMVCQTESGQPLTCEFDNDCCQGFYCGIDQSYSHVSKICLHN